MTTGFVDAGPVSGDLKATVPALRAAAEHAFARRLEPGTLIAVSAPAPIVPSESWLASLPDQEATLFADPAGFEQVGLGARVTLAAEGPDRFRELRRAASSLFLRLKGSAATQRLLGGFAFQSGRPLEAPWAAFGEARFVLPRLRYVRRDGRAFVELILDPEHRHELAADLTLVERALREATLGPSPAEAPRLLAIADRGSSEWTARVEAIRDGISSGHFEKVVTARRVVLELDPRPKAERVLARLRVEAPACTRFAIRRAGVVFLGATPERLIARRGELVETEALAGSIRAEYTARAKELMQSSKDRAEHELVVREIVAALAPLTSELELAEEPEVRTLRHLLHLRTPIRGRLSEPRHVLELVERLHPTPAVGGVPTAAALDWIGTHEPDQRGWYAGPFGWFDPNGDGEFVVALRSGVLDAHRLYLYAGNGIVRASSAEAEWAETRLKLAALLAAAGIDPRQFPEASL